MNNDNIKPDIIIWYLPGIAISKVKSRFDIPDAMDRIVFGAYILDMTTARLLYIVYIVNAIEYTATVLVSVITPRIKLSRFWFIWLTIAKNKIAEEYVIDVLNNCLSK